MKTIFPACLLASLIVCGCGKETKQEAPKAAPAAPAEKSSVSTAIDGFTGKTAVDAGLRARDQIQDISAKKKADQEEF